LLGETDLARAQAEAARVNAEEERASADLLRRRTDALNALFTDLARQEDIGEIMKRVVTHIGGLYGIEPYYSLYSVDADAKHIRCWAIALPPWASAQDAKRIKDTPIPIGPQEGVFSVTYRRGGKLTYFPRIRPNSGNEMEQFVTQLYRMQDFLILPIVEAGRIIAFLNLCSGQASGF